MSNGTASATLEQWRFLEYVVESQFCPVCDYRDNGPGRPHAPDCWIAEKISEAERNAPLDSVQTNIPWEVQHVAVVPSTTASAPAEPATPWKQGRVVSVYDVDVPTSRKWATLYKTIPPERRAKIEEEVKKDLAMIDTASEGDGRVK